ncbi:pectin lyase E [Pestalotiopsis fici W106-1]|uniref:pectin lyase n=1 Tax=Pestalotiopsis fici (strain W106-1 / CGMCC3.15140) TaxID=1229662 RepID=W3X968_PESFW|nr:pectin lyase E [Pestalotiopsis fici W106-1]ETS82663.1 pectin lyase E [Pestalotiopsis fici W106-1]
MKAYHSLAILALVAFQRHATAIPVEGASSIKRAISSVVSGTPMGFASAATGGGDVDPVYPSTIDELKDYLESSDPQVIVISGEYDFVGSEGTSSYTACNAYSCTPSNGGQALLDTVSGCGTTATYTVTIDTAGFRGINVQSNKTLVGKNGATLNGKGLRLVNVDNIIIQNIAITNLNPQYVWGGDAFVLAGTSNIWIDHVTTSLTGRQHYSFGYDASTSTTISNSFLNGQTTNSATCDGHTVRVSIFALLYFANVYPATGNYVYYTSGRTPALSGTTLFHAINNVWSSNSGHALEGTTSTGYGLYEGNYIVEIPTVLDSSFAGQLFTSNAGDVSKCAAYLGRNCVPNTLSNSGAFSSSDTGFLSMFSGKTVPASASVSSIQSTVPSSAGNTL